jgi:hypothetical protein
MRTREYLEPRKTNYKEDSKNYIPQGFVIFRLFFATHTTLLTNHKEQKLREDLPDAQLVKKFSTSHEIRYRLYSSPRPLLNPAE